jgi:hypothetical protein
MAKDIVKKEIRFAIHIPRTDFREDMHYVKQQITYADGSTEPQTFLTKDFKRPIWVTQQAFRNHKEKKEFEEVDRLMRQDVIQSDINKAVAGLLGSPWMASKPDEIKNSPYVYGYDITSTSLIKYTSLKRNDFVQSNYKVSAFDIETDIATREVIIATICFGNRIHSSVLSRFVKNVSNLDKRVHDAVDYYIPKYKDFDITVRTFDNEVDLLTDVFEVANEWGPDFLAIWNMDFDIPRILERLKEKNVNPVDVICDKSVPRKYRICRYKQGIKKKVTASGVVKPINPSLQWHTLTSTSKFYVIDAMCVYRQLRMAKQEEPSYALDAILKKEEIGGKLKFKEADAYSGEKWHIFMQENYPVEYIVYNFYDCLGMLELDEKIKDLKSSLPSFAAITDFAKFNSNPKKIVDALFLFGLERNRVIGTVPKQAKPEEELEADSIETDDDEEEDDEYDVKKYNTLDLKGWIQLLPQNLLLAEGLKCLEEYPDVVTNMRGVVCDQDATAAYPSCTQVGNVSKETCVNEIIKIEGVREDTFREMNLSICLGNANMLEYFHVMFGMPNMLEIDKYLDE